MNPAELQQMMMMIVNQMGQGPPEHPLSRAFGGMPMYGGMPLRSSQVFDLNALGMNPGSPMGMMAGMMIQNMLPRMMGPDFISGQFAPNQNLFDHRYTMQQFANRQRAIQQAAQADSETYFRMIRGGAAMFGSPLQTPEQIASARRFANDFTAISPMLSQMFPETFDQLHGIRGSAQVMATSLSEAGRYSYDPVTGRTGFSGASTEAFSRDVFNRLYGPNADISRMQGIGAGQAGQMYQQMVMRGLGPGAPSGSQLQEALRGIDQSNPQALESALRSFNTTRVTQSIENMAGAVNAMRNIFGDMGRPNAPMLEIFNGLNALTQGGLAHMSPQQLEMNVRRTHALARSTGLGMEGMMGLAGTAGNILEQQGMNRGMAMNIMQSSSAYGFAYGNVGAPRAYGVADREMATQIDVRLRAQAAASPAAGRLAAVMMASNEFVRPDGGVGFVAGTEAHALSEAVRTGQTTYTFGGQTRSVFQAASRVQSILHDSGMSPGQAQRMLTTDPRAFEATIAQYNIQDTVRAGQGALDVDPAFRGAYVSAAATSLRGTAIPARQRSALARDMGTNAQAIVRELMEEDRTLFDTGREADRNRAISQRLRARMGGRLDGVGDNILQNFASQAWLNSEAFVRNPNSGFRNFGNYTNTLFMDSNRTQQLANSTMSDANVMSRIQSALGGVGQLGVAARLSQHIQNLGPGGGNIEDLARIAMGGMASSEVTGPLAGLLNRLSELQDVANNNPAQRDRALADIRALMPDVMRVMEGGANTVPNLSPAARAAIDSYNRRLPVNSAVGAIGGAATAGLAAAGGTRPSPTPPPRPSPSNIGIGGAAAGLNRPPGSPTRPANVGTAANRMDISSRETHIRANNVTITTQRNDATAAGTAAGIGAAAALGGAAGVMAGLPQQRITGTLRLEGLDSVILEGIGFTVTPRSDV